MWGRIFTRTQFIVIGWVQQYDRKLIVDDVPRAPFVPTMKINKRLNVCEYEGGYPGYEYSGVKLLWTFKCNFCGVPTENITLFPPLPTGRHEVASMHMGRTSMLQLSYFNIQTCVSKNKSKIKYMFMPTSVWTSLFMVLIR